MATNDHLKIYKLNRLTCKNVQYVLIIIFGAEIFNYAILEVIWAILDLRIQDGRQYEPRLCFGQS